MTLNSDGSVKVRVEEILDFHGVNREARAYAFLYAAFKRTEVGNNPVRDVLDCLTPFIAPYLNSISGKQVLAENVQEYLAKNFGFRIPYYAIEPLFSSLQNEGFLEYNKGQRAYFATQHESDFDVTKGEIETQFDDVAAGLKQYAFSVGFTNAPPSGSWEKALIRFLKSSTDIPDKTAQNVKGAIIDPEKAEAAIVGNYVQRLHNTNTEFFQKLVNVFMGVLIEEFIVTISEIGNSDGDDPVVIFLDTAVLLRLLGTSGKLLKNATEELTRYLQDLGFNIHFLSGNETEIAGILDTIIYRKDSGQELEGETADAIANGEVSVTDIRSLQNIVTEQLAKANVFASESLERGSLRNTHAQIDEIGFSDYLLKLADKYRRKYSKQNRDNDADYLATVMRLRAKKKTNDIRRCGYLFVTPNKFLAKASRSYLIQQKTLEPTSCPPILSVGQIATIAWLMKDQKLDPKKAGRELLSNCYAAIRPDHEWFAHFRAGIEKITGDMDEYGNDSENMLTLQAARRIAKEESFGETAVFREMNMAEILSRAEEEKKTFLKEAEIREDAIREDNENEIKRLRDEMEDRFTQERLTDADKKVSEVNAAVAAAKHEALVQAKEQNKEKARSKGHTITRYVKFLCFGIFTIGAILTYLVPSNQPVHFIFTTLTGLSLVFNIVWFAEWMGIPVAEKIFDWLEARVARIFE